MSDLYTSETSSEEFECEKCSKTFESKKALALHKKEQHGEKKYGCSLCPQQFVNRGNFVHHNKAQHDNLAASKVFNDNVYTCSECSSEFSTTRGLALHSSIHQQKNMDISPPIQRKELPAFVIPPFQKRKEPETSNHQTIRVIRPEKVPSPEIILEETAKPAFTSSVPVSKSAFEKEVQKHAVNREKFFTTVNESAQEKGSDVSPPKNRIQQREKTMFNIPLEAIRPFLFVEVVFASGFDYVKCLFIVDKVEGENVVVTNRKGDFKLLVHYTQIFFYTRYSATAQYKTGDIIEVCENGRFRRSVFLKQNEQTASVIFPDFKTVEVSIDTIRPFLEEEEVVIPPPKKQKL
jgi:DNA-directed RNA polymerase subunit RPC12/RpoP